MKMTKKQRCYFNIFVICCAAVHFPVGAQPEGSIRIDCGLSRASSSTNEANLKCVPDDAFIHSGLNMQIDYTYKATTPEIYQTLRSFPNFTRNCYSLPAILSKKYIIRASFMYGNYDGLNKMPSFDLYFGVDLWDTIKLENATQKLWNEIVVQAASKLLYVCLVNTGSGTPFISILEQQQLDDDLYAPANSSLNVALKTFLRIDVGSTSIVRHPGDRFDRIWTPDYDSYGTPFSYNRTDIPDMWVPRFYEPSPMLQTAVYSTIINVTINGTFDDNFHVFFFFADVLKPANASGTRQMKIQFNGDDRTAPHVRYLKGSGWYTINPSGNACYRYTIQPANSSDVLGAVLNGFEVYKVKQLSGSSATLSQDVDAINSIRDYYHVKKNWVGDPCLPQGASWDGLICKSDSYGNQTIVALDLFNSGLKGNIPDYFSSMGNLRTLNLSGNSLCGSIPSGLQAKVNDGLKLSIDSNLNCSNTSKQDGSKRRNEFKIVISILSSLFALAVLALLVIVIMIMLKNRKQGRKLSLGEQKSGSFTYDEIIGITNNFERLIGKGGSGHVYHGFLKSKEAHASDKDGLEVAVKVMGGSLSQGIKEFTAEVQLLLQVHHKYLATFIGFCDEGNKMILVYEYMSRGNLRELLSDETGTSLLLDWMRRLRIALSTAIGLDYLHTGCRTPIIHRDVKTRNILINESLEAKIADFGLSKIGNTDNVTHITTAAAGTPGYMDPEYYKTNKLTEKSDVYSFGVVLFELITGQCPIFTLESERVHLVQWVTPQIVRGDIASIVDPRLHGQYDINSLQKVVDTAMACSAEKAIARPTMTQVVNGLREAMDTETYRTRGESSFGKAASPSSGSRFDSSELSIPSVR